MSSLSLIGPNPIPVIQSEKQKRGGCQFSVGVAMCAYSSLWGGYRDRIQGGPQGFDILIRGVIQLAFWKQYIFQKIQIIE